MIKTPAHFWCLGAHCLAILTLVALLTGGVGSRSVALDEMLIQNVAALQQPFASRLDDDELIKALESAPADYALVLKLRFLDEMPLKRIAAFLGAPLSTVKWRLHQGKKLLRQELKRSGEA